MLKSLLSGVRSRLIFLFCVILLPVFVLRILDFREQREIVIEQGEKHAMAVFNLAAASEEAFLLETQEILSRLSTVPEVIRQEGCAEYLSRLQTVHPRYMMIGVAREDGKVVCSTASDGKPIDLSERDFFRNALETGAFTVGSHRSDPAPGRTTISYGYPFLGAGKKNIGGVVFAVRDISDPSDFEKSLSPIVPPGSAFAMIDNAGAVLSTSLDSPDLPVGKRLDERLFRKILEEKQGSFVYEGTDGAKRLYLFSAARVVPLGEEPHLLSSIPMENLLEAADKSFVRNLGSLAVLSLLLVLVLWFVINRTITRPIGRFVEASRRLASGDLAARVGPMRNDEFGNLGTVFDDMGAELEKKTQALEKQASLRKAAEDRLTHILNASPAVIFVCPVPARGADSGDPARMFVPIFISENVRDMLGYDVKEALTPGSPLWAKKVHPEDLPKAMDLKGLFRKGKLAREYRIMAKGGEFRWVLEHLAVVRDDSGTPVEVMGSWIDITERKQSEEDLVLLRMAVDQSAEGVVLLDTAARVLYANPVFGKITEYTLDEMKGRNFLTLNVGRKDEAYYQAIKDVLDQGKVWKDRVILQRRDGSSSEIDATASPVFDANGRIVHYVCSCSDITRESALQKKLQDAQRLESVGVLAGGIAHDFNNLLTGIFGFTEMAMVKAGDEGELQSYLAEIEKCARSAAALTRQLLAYSRRQIISPVNLNLNDAVVGLMKLIARVLGEGIEIRTSLADGMPTVRADVGQIEQILMNLVINARDAMPDGGTLRIETGAGELDGENALSFPGFRHGRYAILKVADTGIGMDEETLGKVFDPFFTTKPRDKGTGLGLAVVYGIVKQHEGFIEVQSEPGRGSAFRVYLPVVDAAADVIGTARPADVRGGSEVVLLAEDNDTVRFLGRETLKAYGYTVLEAANGEEAVAEYKRNRDRISLVLLDLVMPVMGGQEAYAEMARLDRDVPVLLMSGHKESVALESFSRGLRLPFLPKPFSPKDLAGRVREVLDRAGA